MQLDITYEPGEEELVIVMDDALVLKAMLGDDNELVINEAFMNLDDENPQLYQVLRKTARLILQLSHY